MHPKIPLVVALLEHIASPLYVAEFVKRGLIHASDFPNLKRHNFICKQAIQKVLLPNFKAVGPIEAKLHILKFEKLDECIRPLFTNSVTY